MDPCPLLAKQDFSASKTERSLFPFPFSQDCVGGMLPSLLYKEF